MFWALETSVILRQLMETVILSAHNMKQGSDSVFNLESFKGGHFVRFQMKIKHCQIFPYSPNVKDGIL